MSFWPQQTLAVWRQALQNGQVTAAPAEGVYGYCANPFNAQALQKIMDIKQRSPGKGLITLIGNLEQLKQLCPPLNSACGQAIKRYWPGPVTLILPALPEVPQLLSGGQGTLAIRFPAAAYMQEYLGAAATPLVSTSLNVSGEPPALTAAQIPAGTPALTLPQPLSGTPSRIFNPLSGQWLR